MSNDQRTRPDEVSEALRTLRAAMDGALRDPLSGPQRIGEILPGLLRIIAAGTVTYAQDG